MAKMAEVKIFDNSNDNTKWELEKELEYQPLWDLAHGENPHQSAGILKTSGMADFEIIGEDKMLNAFSKNGDFAHLVKCWSIFSVKSIL